MAKISAFLKVALISATGRSGTPQVGQGRHRGVKDATGPELQISKSCFRPTIHPRKHETVSHPLALKAGWEKTPLSRPWTPFSCPWTPQAERAKSTKTAVISNRSSWHVHCLPLEVHFQQRCKRHRRGKDATCRKKRHWTEKSCHLPSAAFVFATRRF